jgi:molybdenum cofactor cytidylyltransferase
VCSLARGGKEGAVNIVILAAGTSSRMGGAHKLLLELDGQTLLQRSVKTALEVSPKVLVVLGRDAELVQQSLLGFPVGWVVNHEFKNGKMETSFQVAIEVLNAQDTIFMLADMPLVNSHMLHELIIRRGAGVQIVASRFGQVLAPPHLFAAALLPEVAQFGAKPTILRHLEQTVFCDWSEELLFDVDTPEDWDKLRHMDIR